MSKILNAGLVLLLIGILGGVILHKAYVVDFCEKQGYVLLGGFGEETLICVVNYKD